MKSLFFYTKNIWTQTPQNQWFAKLAIMSTKVQMVPAHVGAWNRQNSFQF